MMIINKTKYLIIIFLIISSTILSPDDSIFNLVPPANKFILTGWKLQIPGPIDILDLKAYTSKYFYLNENDEMCFWLDSSEKGTTKNTVYVRSELRNLLNWNINSYHKMTATLRVESSLKPDKATVLKIHGFTKPGEYAPTLLRIAYNYGNLYAYINNLKNIDKVLLISDINKQIFKCSIVVDKKYLKIEINGEEKINRDISYWKIENYFKAGCYPQSRIGEIKVIFNELLVE